MHKTNIDELNKKLKYCTIVQDLGVRARKTGKRKDRLVKVVIEHNNQERIVKLADLSFNLNYGKQPIYHTKKYPRTAHKREHSTWRSMLTRCNDTQHKNYKRYGGRGIRVCERWLDFDNFMDDMGKRPEGMTLDRINNDGDYAPNNCQWLSHAHQNRKRKTTKLNWEIVGLIRYLSKEGWMNKDIGKLLNILPRTISDVKLYKSWKYE